LWTDLISGGQQQTLPLEHGCFGSDGADIKREVTVRILNVYKKNVVILVF
jgi:hypothetical protein